MILKRNLLSVSLATALLALASGVSAQTTAVDAEDEASKTEEEAAQLDAIVVTGIRASIESAIDAKQNATSIVESISAEDIGKLPDQSIADSIARLPGVTAQRDRGRARDIHIRGLSGDFSTTTLNGREQVSMSNSRGVEFDQYPSELMSQVLVYKTPDASLIGQGLSGTVDLRTIRPLDYGKQAVAFNVRGDMNKIDDDKTYGNRGSFSYIDQFADNTVGLALGYARLNNPGQGSKFESWGYDNGAIGGAQLYDYENDNTRDGLMATLEFRPNDSYHMVLDAYYSRFDRKEDERGMEFGTTWGGATLLSRTDSPGGIAQQATWSNVRPIVRNDYNAIDDRLSAIGWNHKFQINESWTFNADLATSSGRRDERILEFYSVLPEGVGDNVSASFNRDGYFDFDFGLDYADPDNLRFADPGGWGGDRAQAGYLKDFDIRDDLNTLRIDLERSFESGWISTVKFGINQSDRTKSRASVENTLCLTTACTENVFAGIPSEFVIGPTTLLGGTPIMSLNLLGLLNSNVFSRLPKDNADITNKNWEVDETVRTAFIQANIDTDLGSVPLRGNFGVQFVDVDQESSGFITYAGNPLGDPVTGGADYTEILPSLNLIFSLPQEQAIRLAAARQLARPRLDDMRASGGYGIERNNQPPPGLGLTLPYWSGGGGNPELRPWKANALDISYEKYFGNRGYFSIGYFYKDLLTYIYSQQLVFDFTDLPIPAGTLPDELPASNLGVFTREANGEGGTLRGYELALSVPFDLWFEPLEGFGVQASYTDTTTNIAPDGPGTSTPLPGFSKYTSNVTLYFERHGFSIRGSRRSRSAFLGEQQGFGGDLVQIVQQGEAVVDFQTGYTFQDGPMKDLSILFQVSNLTDEPYRTAFDNNSETPRQYFEYGRNYLLGFSYRF